VPHGIAILASNAGHTGTWQHQWRELARTSPRWCFEQWAQPAPWLDPDEIEEARQRNTATRFNRLWHGVWSPNSGDALSPELIEDAIVLQGPQRQRLDGWRYVCGLDLGISNDHAATVVLGCAPESNKISLVAVRSWAPPKGGQIDLLSVENYVARLHQKFGLTAVWYDPFQAVLLSQNLRRRGLRVEAMNFSGANLNRMASALLETFASHSIELFNEPALVRDLLRLSIVERSYGYRLESTRDADGHCDRAVAMTICLPAGMTLAHQTACRNAAPSRAARPRGNPMQYGVLLARGMASRPPDVYHP
jgi:hypothetical protein